MNAAILLSAWSAAASDIYISSRFLFFLAREKHAPSFLAHIVRYPRVRVRSHAERDGSDDSSSSDVSDDESAATGRGGDGSTDGDSAAALGEGVRPRAQPTYVMPLASVLVSASVGLLTVLSYNAGSAATVFDWLVSVASVASLQSWAAMLFTYIRCVRRRPCRLCCAGGLTGRLGGKVVSRDGVLRTQVQG